MSDEIITMRRRERQGDGLGLKQPGDFMWLSQPQGSILIWFPSTVEGRPYVCQRLLRYTDGEDWTREGRVDGMAEWDGDRDRPTLSAASIQIREMMPGHNDEWANGWHGYIHKGLMGTDREVLEKAAQDRDS